MLDSVGVDDGFTVGCSEIEGALVGVSDGGFDSEVGAVLGMQLGSGMSMHSIGLQHHREFVRIHGMSIMI